MTESFIILPADGKTTRKAQHLLAVWRSENNEEARCIVPTLQFLLVFGQVDREYVYGHLRHRFGTIRAKCLRETLAGMFVEIKEGLEDAPVC